MVKVSKCIYCGELGGHDTPRQNKNCARRHRSTSTPVIETAVSRQPVFKSAYIKRLYSLGIIVFDDEQVDNPHN
jgi:hypothetical protein